jgi:hypothetical protein
MGFSIECGENWKLRLSSGSTLSTIKGYYNNSIVVGKDALK